MAETTEELTQHLAALEDFEPRYRAYVKQRKSGSIHINRAGPRAEVSEGEWPRAKLEERKNELLELGPSVDEALMAAGVGVPAMTHPPALGGGLKAKGVTSLMFNHEQVGGDASGYAMSNMILERVVAGKGALKTKLKRSSLAGQAIGKRVPKSRPPWPGRVRRAFRWSAGEAWKFAVLVAAAVVAGVILLVLFHVGDSGNGSVGGGSTSNSTTTGSHSTIPGAAATKGDKPRSTR